MARVNVEVDRLGLKAFELRSEIDNLIQSGADISVAGNAQEEEDARRAHQELIDQKRRELRGLLQQMATLDQE